MEKKTGIILKTLFPKKMKIVLLDAQLGKIEGVPSHDQLWAGSLLSYHTQLKGSLYFLYDINVTDMPLWLAKHDILFLHHVLEVCYFCVPFDAQVPEIFSLVNLLYEDNESYSSKIFKIVFLFKLFVLLGMHPEEARFQDPFYYLLARESIDTIMYKSIHLNTKEILHDWVYACISIHPQIHVFKTLHFFKENRPL